MEGVAGDSEPKEHLRLALAREAGPSRLGGDVDELSRQLDSLVAEQRRHPLPRGPGTKPHLTAQDVPDAVTPMAHRLEGVLGGLRTLEARLETIAAAARDLLASGGDALGGGPEATAGDPLPPALPQQAI